MTLGSTLHRDHRSACAGVLLACVRGSIDSETTAELREALGRVADWDVLTGLALLHGMSGLLYQRVNDLCPDAVPETVLESWRTRWAGIAARSYRMQRELVAVLDVLDAAGIPALAYKGAALSKQVYGDSTLRLFNDVDVLVRPDAVAAARDVMIGMGYVDLHPSGGGIGSRWVPGTGEQELVYQHPVSRIVVELHWWVGPRFEEHSLSAESLFTRSSAIELLDHRVPCLGPLDLVLALSVHAATHKWLRLEDVAAMRAALESMDEPAAGELEVLARSIRCQRRLHVGVLVAASLAHSALPECLGDWAMSDRSAVHLASLAQTRLVASLDGPPDFEDPGPLDRVRGALWEARSLDSFRATARYTWSRLFAPGVHDYQAESGWQDGPAEALATQWRRQKRLWSRNRK